MNRYERRKRWSANIKYRVGCQLCEEREPSVLTYHHLRDRRYAPGSRLTNRLDGLLAEMEKCIVLCLNCKRKVERGIYVLEDVNAPNYRELHEQLRFVLEEK